MPTTTTEPEATTRDDRTAEAAAEELAGPGQEVAVVEHVEQSPGDLAIRAAAQAAMEQASMPERSEFLTIAQMALMFSQSDLAPAALRDKPYNAFMVLMTGRDLGISLSAALRKVYVVDGQPSLAPQLGAALVRQRGLGRIVPYPGGDDAWAAAVPIGPGGMDPRCKLDNHEEGCRCDLLGPPVEFTWGDAQVAGLVRPDCEPGNHSDACERAAKSSDASSRRSACKQNYRTYPRRMLWWRAVGYCVDDYFPEVTMGLYSPDELGALTDEEGHPIDPATVTPPEGYSKPESQRKAERQAERDRELAQPADELDLLDLQIRVTALPEEQQGLLRTKWMEHERLSGHRLAALPQPLLRLAQALVQGIEHAARAATKNSPSPWDPGTARAQVVSALTALASPQEPAGAAEEPEEPQDAPEPPEGDQDPPDAEEGQEEPQGPRSRHADDDPTLPDVLAHLRDVLDSAPQDLIDGTAEEVKSLHHARVDAIIREHGEEPTGRHIDTRRMMACAYLVAEAMEEAG